MVIAGITGGWLVKLQMEPEKGTCLESWDNCATVCMTSLKSEVINMSFQAFCPECKKKVTAFTSSPPDLSDQSLDLHIALDRGGRIEVMHPADGGVHRWIVSDTLKSTRRKCG
jgi:hypothetical protein